MLSKILLVGTVCALAACGVTTDDPTGSEPGQKAATWRVAVDETVPIGLRGFSHKARPSLALDSGGAVHAVVNARGESGSSRSFYAVRGPSGWTKLEEVGTVMVGVIGIDADERPIVANPGFGFSGLKRRVGGEWTSEDVDIVVRQILTDPTGRLHLVGYRDTDVVMLAEGAGGEWVSQTLGAVSGWHGSPGLQALFRDDGSVVALYPEPSGLRLADSATTTPLELTSGSFGSSSLALGPDGSAQVLLNTGNEVALFEQTSESVVRRTVAADAIPSAEACEGQTSPCKVPVTVTWALGLAGFGHETSAVFVTEDRTGLRLRECDIQGSTHNPKCDGGADGDWETSLSGGTEDPENQRVHIGGASLAMKNPLPEQNASVVVDKLGRIHVAVYQDATDDWEDGMLLRYVRFDLSPN